MSYSARCLLNLTKNENNKWERSRKMGALPFIIGAAIKVSLDGEMILLK